MKDSDKIINKTLKLRDNFSVLQQKVPIIWDIETKGKIKKRRFFLLLTGQSKRNRRRVTLSVIFRMKKLKKWQNA